MEWRVYASRKEYEESDGGQRPTHIALEQGEYFADARQGVWAARPKPGGEGVDLLYVRKRPGKGKAFYYRVEGETAPAERTAKPKPKPKPKGMDPLFEI